MKESTLSAEDKRNLLQNALSPSPVSLDQPSSPRPWIRDVWDDKVVYELNGKSYQMKYSIASDGSVKLGEPIEVIQQTVYKPVKDENGKKYPFIGK